MRHRLLHLIPCNVSTCVCTLCLHTHTHTHARTHTFLYDYHMAVTWLSHGCHMTHCSWIWGLQPRGPPWWICFLSRPVLLPEPRVWEESGGSPQATEVRSKQRADNCHRYTYVMTAVCVCCELERMWAISQHGEPNGWGQRPWVQLPVAPPSIFPFAILEVFGQ